MDFLSYLCVFSFLISLSSSRAGLNHCFLITSGSSIYCVPNKCIGQEEEGKKKDTSLCLCSHTYLILSSNMKLTQLKTNCFLKTSLTNDLPLL